MPNPFGQRASELLKDDESFLSVIAPSPLTAFFQQRAENGELFDRLVKVIGTPGSGKTTIARLFEYRTLRTLERHQGTDSWQALAASLAECRVLENGKPRMVGCRIPLESEYRDFFELPYSLERQVGLLVKFMEARAVLAWIRNLRSGGHSLDSISIRPRTDAHAAVDEIGGTRGPELLARAEEVERAIYRVVAALVSPEFELLPAGAVDPYRPFDVIEAFQIVEEDGTRDLVPLAMFDDAHALHPTQLQAAVRWFTRRELRPSRWFLLRFDPLSPDETWAPLARESTSADEPPGLTVGRDFIEIRLQASGRRDEDRRAFRRMATDMANRYLQRMEVFSRRELVRFRDLLRVDPPSVPATTLKKLINQVSSVQKQLGISNRQRAELESSVAAYIAGATGDVGEDMRPVMLRILMHRYANRVPQQSLFDQMDDAAPSRPVSADAGVADGARLWLLHKEERPYFFGPDKVADASTENAEQFLQLAEILVSQSETQLVRGRSPTLTAQQQSTLLRQRANDIVKRWDFPSVQEVRRLSEWIAKTCVARTLEHTAPLGGGAGGVGILMSEFADLATRHPELEATLRYGSAYNAFSIQRDKSVKDRVWCVIELGGLTRLIYGLTLNRGGFVEVHAQDLAQAIQSG